MIPRRTLRARSGLRAIALLVMIGIAGCADSGTSSRVATATDPTVEAPPIATPATSLSSELVSPSATSPLVVAPPTTLRITTSASASATAHRSTTTTTTTTTIPRTTPYVVPIADPNTAGWGTTHAAYKATDIFVAGGCGGTVVSPVNGTALEVRTVDLWNSAVDNPATRGGRSVAVLGDDGVRYYMAHFATIDAAIVVGQRVAVGQTLGTVGRAGRASACHVHFGISPPCPAKEWSIRRGVVWPYPYLDAWKRGEQSSPAAEVAAWVAANPTACADASADPYAADA